MRLKSIQVKKMDDAWVIIFFITTTSADITLTVKLQLLNSGNLAEPREKNKKEKNMDLPTKTVPTGKELLHNLIPPRPKIFHNKGGKWWSWQEKD